MEKERFTKICLHYRDCIRDRVGIGTLGEKTLHAILKDYFQEDRSFQEFTIDGYVADVVSEGEIIEIYTGWRKYKSSDKFIISMYSKANPDDNFKTQIELDDEKYTFIKIESYDQIIK